MKKYVLGLFLCLVVVLAVGCTNNLEQLNEPNEEATEQVEEIEVETEPLMDEVEETESEDITLASEVKILGLEGFEPAEVSIVAGDSLTFVNNEATGKEVALVLQNKETRLSKSSGKLKFGESYEYVFEQTGVWEVWSAGHGVKLMVTVE